MRVKMQQPAYNCEKMQMCEAFVNCPIPDADLLQNSVNNFCEHYNCFKIRKQHELSLPSGHSPKVTWRTPPNFDGNASK